VSIRALFVRSTGGGTGKRLLTDGPFAETREHPGGYMLIDVENLDAAIAAAARAPLARVGTIEVRPVREGPPTAP